MKAAALFLATVAAVVIAPDAWRALRSRLATRLAPDAYRRGYDRGHARGWDAAYGLAWCIGFGAGAKSQARQNAREMLGLEDDDAPVDEAARVLAQDDDETLIADWFEAEQRGEAA
jgi:hypothetical protein